jgi:hypothetical protein
MNALKFVLMLAGTIVAGDRCRDSALWTMVADSYLSKTAER